MDNIENLKTVFDSVVKNDDDAAEAAFHAYVVAKTADMIAAKRAAINEEKSPIKLKGNDVYVEDKLVGSVKHDVDDSKGLEYTSADGKKKKFENLQAMYAHIGTECKLGESVKSFEKEVQALPNRDKTEEDVKAFEDGKDGKPAEGPAKRKKAVEKLVDDITK